MASDTDGIISSSYFTSRLLDNTSGLWSTTTESNIYWNTPAPYEVHIKDEELYGYLWGKSVGWISLNCKNTSSCSMQDFKVRNDSEGNLSGYAWGEHTGWISFSCANPETNNCNTNQNARVIIDNEGHFTGHAWTENFGWVEFDCDTDSTACVQTDWRPTSSRNVPTPPGQVAGAISIQSGAEGSGGRAAPTTLVDKEEVDPFPVSLPAIEGGNLTPLILSIPPAGDRIVPTRNLVVKVTKTNNLNQYPLLEVTTTTHNPSAPLGVKTVNDQASSEPIKKALAALAWGGASVSLFVVIQKGLRLF